MERRDAGSGSDQQPTIGSTNLHPLHGVRNIPLHQQKGNRISQAAGRIGGAMTREWHANAPLENREALTETRRLRKQIRYGTFDEGHDLESTQARLDQLTPLTKVKPQ